MPPKKQPEEGLIVVLDVGKSMVSGSNPRIMDAKRALQVGGGVGVVCVCCFGFVGWLTFEKKTGFDSKYDFVSTKVPFWFGFVWNRGSKKHP